MNSTASTTTAEQKNKNRPVRRSDLTVHEIDGEALIFDARSADTHRLNTTANFIWRLCDGSHDIDDITTLLTDTYDVSAEQAKPQVEKIIERFEESSLLDHNER